MIQTTLYQALSSLVAGRVYYEVIPETNSQYPVIVYQFIHIEPNSALEEGDLEDYQVQIDLYSKDPDDTFRLRKPIFTALKNAFEFAERINDHSDYEQNTKLYRRIITYQITYGD